MSVNILLDMTSVHLDISLTWPSYYNGGSFTMRNRHVSNTAPCLLCSCACLHDLHIIHMSTSRHHLSNMALLLQWRLIYYAKSPCVQYSPMSFMQLRVSARPSYHIIHMSTSRHHLSNMALLLQWLIYYAKSPCVQYSPMPFMQLRVSARPPYHTYEYI